MKLEINELFNGTPQIKLVGNLDVWGMLEVGTDLAKALHDKHAWYVVDLEQVGLISRSGVRILQECHLSLAKGGFGLIVIGGGERIRECLRHVKANDRFATFDSLEEALNSLESDTLAME